MRQFVLGLAVAGFAWWGYGKWSASEGLPGGGVQRVAAPTGATGGGTAGRSSLGDILGGPVAGGAVAGGPAAGGAVAGGAGTAQDAALSGAGRAAPAAPPAAPPAAAASSAQPSDLAGLIEGLERRDRAAIGLGWLAVASGRLGLEHDRVVKLLQPSSDDFAAQLAALGSHNAFLRSPEGRAAAKQATAAAMALPDEDAIDAGTSLLYLMTCGRIERADRERRAVVDAARDQHRVRVDRWLCNPTNVSGARVCTVQSGDSLDRIAKRFRREGVKVEAGTLQVLNRISNPNVIAAGQTIKVPVAPISAVLQKRSYALMVFVGDQLLRLYWVGHGKDDRTPVTEFEVIAKQDRPDWTAPDGNVYPYGHKENVLGEFFIKFGHAQYSGFGAHGTTEPQSICTQASMGCIRMFDQDIEELFRVLPRGARVGVRATEAR